VVPVESDEEKKNRKVNLFKNQPIFFKCPHCGHSGHTIVDQKTTYISYVLMVFVIFAFGLFFSFMMMPFVILLTRTFYHRCSVCLGEVGADNKLLSIINLEDKVISLSIGEFGLVLTRKIVVGILLTIVVIFFIYMSFDPHGGHGQGPVVKIDDSWEKFMTECGRETIAHGGIAKSIGCDQHYIEKTIVNWRGYIIRVEDYRDSFYRYMHHAIGLLIKMQPSESDLYPDIILALDTEKANEFGDLIGTFNRGTEIIFNATIMTVGSEMKTRHFHIVEMTKGEGFMDLPAHVHEYGRYADKPKFLGNSPAA
jgi:hypothetical protein